MFGILFADNVIVVVGAPTKYNICQSCRIFAERQIIADLLRDWLHLILMLMAKKYIEKARDARTGQYVPLEYAKKHPSVTVIEREKKKK